MHSHTVPYLRKRMSITLADPSDHLQCGWADGPRGCPGNDSISALLPYKEVNAWAQESGITCPAGRLVSLGCAAKNLLDGQPRQLCLRHAQDHSIGTYGKH